jgi:hypothetical protein
LHLTLVQSQECNILRKQLLQLKLVAALCMAPHTCVEGPSTQPLQLTRISMPVRLSLMVQVPVVAGALSSVMVHLSATQVQRWAGTHRGTSISCNTCAQLSGTGYAHVRDTHHA